MNSKRDIIAFCILAAASVAVTMYLVITNQHIPPKPKSDLWPKLTACKIDKHYLEGKYGIHYTPEVKALEGKHITLDGFLLPLEAGEKSTHFLLTVRAPSCPYCLPAAPNQMAEVFTTKPLAWSDQMTSLSGTLKLMPDKSADGIFFQLLDASTDGSGSSATAQARTYKPKPIGDYLFAKPVDAHTNDFIRLSQWQGKPVLVMFWRSDCPPCLIELRNIPDMLTAHKDLQVALISLQDMEHTRNKLPKLPKNVTVLVAQDDGGELLAAFGNDKRLALPYSVILDARGRRCTERNGILTPQILDSWVKQCAVSLN